MRWLQSLAIVFTSLVFLGLVGLRSTYRIPLGDREDKHFLHYWGERHQVDGEWARELRPGAVFHLHGLDRSVAYRVRIAWKSPPTAESLRIAANGRDSVAFGRGAVFQEDRFDMPPVPDRCLLLRLHPPTETGTFVRSVELEPHRLWTVPPGIWIAFVLLLPQVVFFFAGQHRFAAGLSALLAAGLVTWICWRPADYLYATVYQSALPLSFFGGSLWLAWVGLRPRLDCGRARTAAASVAGFLALAVGLTYSFTLSFDFIREDLLFVRAPSVTQMISAATGSWLSPNPFLQDFYRPLVILSYAAEFPIYGMWAPGYHLTNLILLVGCGLMLYAIAYRLVPSARMALAVATFFVLHPYHYIAASWISARTDTLALLFYLATILVWPRRPLLACLLAAGAFLSKEMAATLPLSLLLFDLLLRRKSPLSSTRSFFRRHGPILVLWGLYLAFLWWRFPTVRSFATARLGISSGGFERGGMAFGHLMEIEILTLFSPFAGWLSSEKQWILAIPGVLVLGALIACFFPSSFGLRPRVGLKARRLILAGLLWIPLTCLPILNEAGFEFHRMGSLLAVGSSFVVLGLVSLVSRFGSGGLARASVAVALTLWMGAMYVEDIKGSLDQHPYSTGMVLLGVENYRNWSPYLPETTARQFRLRASGRHEHGWPIYRRDPPPFNYN